MVDNAYISAKPPVLASRKVTQQSPLEAYICQLIFVDIGKPNGLSTVEKQARRLPWFEVEDIVVKCLTDCSKLKYNHISLVAELVYRLTRSRSTLAIKVTDRVLETLRQGLEFNKWDAMQRRLTNIKLLGELYVLRLVDSQTIFDVLYTLIALGHGPGYASEQAKDPPNEFTRVRLVCTLLETVGQYFVKGSARRKLDVFLKYFQRYVLAKGDLPIDVDFTVQDCFELLRPKLKQYTSFDEACEDVARIEEIDRKSESIKGKHDNRALAGSSARPVQLMETLEEGSDDGEEVDGEGMEEDGEEIEDPEEDAEEDEEDERDEEEEADEEDGIEEAAEGKEEDENEQQRLSEERELYSRGERARVAQEMEEDFDRHFEAMMMESIAQQKSSETPRNDLAIPSHVRYRRDGNSSLTQVGAMQRDPDDDDDDSDEEQREEPKMAFQLLSRRGKTVATTELLVPLKSHFAMRHQAKEEAEKLEKERLRDQVLAMEAMDEDEDAMARR